LAGQMIIYPYGYGVFDARIIGIDRLISNFEVIIFAILPLVFVFMLIIFVFVLMVEI
jgi:hypothetical protein